VHHPGCHSRVSGWSRGPYQLSLPGVRLVTWTILGYHSRVSDWSRGPSRLSSSGCVLAVTPGCQIGYTDRTGCRQLNRVLTHNNNDVKSGIQPTLLDGRRVPSSSRRSGWSTRRGASFSTSRMPTSTPSRSGKEEGGKIFKTQPNDVLVFWFFPSRNGGGAVRVCQNILGTY
jgi:hypothetical protein